jgi:hypothetical protein
MAAGGSLVVGNVYVWFGGLEHGFYDFPYIGNNHPKNMCFFPNSWDDDPI